MEMRRLRDGWHVRFRKKRIPTREQLLAVAAKARTESFEGSFLGRLRLPRHTVAELWKSYAPAAERDNHSWATDKGRAKRLLRYLGNMQADRLTLKKSTGTVRREGEPARDTAHAGDARPQGRAPQSAPRVRGEVR